MVSELEARCAELSAAAAHSQDSAAAAKAAAHEAGRLHKSAEARLVRNLASPMLVQHCLNSTGAMQACTPMLLLHG